MSKLLIIIPTYNEIENIEAISSTVLGLSDNYHLLVVDDGSPDGTGSKVKSMMDQYKDRLHLIERSGKLGLGTAYIEGFKFALSKDYEFIMEMDADFSHDPNKIAPLLEGCQEEGVGMAVGSRYVKGGGFKNWSKYRLMLSKGASIYTRLITWMPVKDATAGFVVYKREVLEKMDLSKIKFVGYAFQIEMKYYCYKLGYKIKEVPIVFVDRELGTSKMNSSIISEAILGVLQMKFRDYSAK
ncbi:MAG: polyprenol monophosphomannose synthase [Saprospiraceae bacterium]|nr:polyprenol monophosphomannose synthase [Saprospiraceae bacterium]